MFAECLQVLYMKHKAGRDMRFLLATALVIFALITVVRLPLDSRTGGHSANWQAGVASRGRPDTRYRRFH